MPMNMTAIGWWRPATAVRSSALQTVEYLDTPVSLS